MNANPESQCVLVVDDEPDICEALELALTMEGYRVAAAHDRDAALRLLTTAKPVVILLDYCMPGLNAQDFVDQVKTSRATAPIVLMTGTKDPGEQARALGISHFLPKPFELDDMLKLVRQCAS